MYNESFVLVCACEFTLQFDFCGKEEIHMFLTKIVEISNTRVKTFINAPIGQICKQ